MIFQGPFRSFTFCDSLCNLKQNLLLVSTLKISILWSNMFKMSDNNYLHQDATCSQYNILQISEKVLLGQSESCKIHNREITSCFTEQCPILQLRWHKSNKGKCHHIDIHPAELWCSDLFQARSPQSFRTLY